jgi:hypothetical protein
VTVNLEDGMDQDKATKVGVKVFESSMGASYRLRSVRVDEQGIWKVKFDWGAKGEYLGHWFEAVINPFTRTVVYDHCK